MSSENVSIVPGNHDVYTRGADRARRFLDYFAPNVTSDLSVAVDPWGAFPFVRFRGPLALIGLRTAVPRAPMIASGELGTGQIEALRGIFAHPELRKRLPVFLMHHPPINPRSRRSTFSKGLTDADWFCATLQHLREGLVLHGHLHNRVHRRLPTHEGNIDVVGATSASLDHEHMDAMAGFNLYEISNDGYLANTEAWVMQGDSFVRREIPMS